MCLIVIERFYLDVVYDWFKCFGVFLVFIFNIVFVLGNFDWFLLVYNGYSFILMVGYVDLNEFKVVMFFLFLFFLYVLRILFNGYIRLGEDFEVEECLYDMDFEIFDVGDFGDFDGYLVFEEEGE